MSQTTYLDYTCAPNPLTEGATQDIVVIATLKSESELGAPLTSATIDKIVLDFGTIGSGARQLTETAFVLDNIEAPSNWTPTVSGATCTLTPASGHGEIITNAVIIKVKNVAINNTSGNVTLAISEAATPAPQTSGEPPTTTPGTPGVENIILPKIAPGESEISFSAQPATTEAGQGTTLSWSGGSSSDTYTLLYLKEGSLQSISTHADNSTLGADDAYPNTGLTPPDPGLTLNATTTFILQIQKSGGEVINKTTTVIVSQPNIYAQTLQVSGTASTGPLTLNGAPGGKVGDGSRVVFGTSGDIVSIEENWGLNLFGGAKHPVTSHAHFVAKQGISASNGLTVDNATVNGNITADSIIVNGNLTLHGNIIITGQGGRTHIGTLNQGNNYSSPTLFTGSNSYKRYEIYFNAIEPNSNGNHDGSFGARLYIQGAAEQPYTDNIYYSEVYGNDWGGNNAETNNDNYLRLWPAQRQGPSTTGLDGNMTLYASSVPGYNAFVYAPTQGNSWKGCQGWIMGGLGSPKQIPINGIEFNFYSGNGIKSGTIDIYGFN